MNPILYIVSLFYHWFYNKKSSQIIAYESAVMTFSAVFFSSIMILLKLFGFNMSFGIDKSTKAENYLLAGIIILVLSFIISLIAPKKKILAINFKLRDEYQDYAIMFIYMIASFLILIFVAKRF